jgi:hypothetical protein
LKMPILSLSAGTRLGSLSTTSAGTSISDTSCPLRNNAKRL